MTIYIYTVCLCVWCVQLSPTLYFSLYTYIYYIYIIPVTALSVICRNMGVLIVPLSVNCSVYSYY